MSSLTTVSDIRLNNKVRVLKYTRNKGEITQPQLAYDLNLSKPTVSAVIDELIVDGFIEESGLGQSTDQGGKRPKLYSFNPKDKCIISIYLGFDRVNGALLDFNANVLYQIIVQTSVEEDKYTIMEKIGETISKLLIYAHNSNKCVLGIGGGSPGLIDTASGTIIQSVHYKKLNGLKLGELSERFKLPMWIDNECHNIAIADKWFGLGKNVSNYVSLVTDIGIGSGIIIDNNIIRGIDNTFGEIGHTVISNDGPLCHCGNRGCWESFASSKALLKRVAASRPTSTVLKHLVSSDEQLTVSHIVQAIREGDAIVKQIALDEYAEYLSIGIVNIVNTFNPELIIIHGEITRLGEKLRVQVEKNVKENALPTPASRVKIVFSQLGENRHIIGAGALAIKELFEAPEYLFVS